MPRRPSRLARVIRVRRRRATRGLVALLVAGHQWLPSWGTSLLVHAVALLILAVLYLGSTGRRDPSEFVGEIGEPGPLGESLTILAPGDPIASADSAGSPSFSFTPAPAGITTTGRPSPPPTAPIAPALAAPRIALPSGTRLTDRVRGLVHAEDMTAPFAGRDPAMKAKLLAREGGSAGSERAVQLGLDWLARHQRADGAWTLDCQAQCSDPPCPDPTSAVSDTAATGLGLLPMLGAGHIHTRPSRYRDNVERGLAYLVAHQGPEGEMYLGGGFNYRFYSHAIATMALCEAYGLSGDPKLRLPAQRGLNFIAKNQNLNDGGWRYVPGQEGDTSVIGWQVFALRSGRLAGLDVPARTIRGCKHYLDIAACDPQRVTYAYLPGKSVSPVMTAEALLCREYLGWPADFPALRKGAGVVVGDLYQSNDRNIYYWYYATQLLHNLGGKEWVAWNRHVRDGLIGMQVVGPGCDRGSWSPTLPRPDRWGVGSGRHYTTALSLLTLEVYYRFLPLYRHADPPADPKAVKAADRAAAKGR